MKVNEYFYPALVNENRFLFLIGGAGSGKSRLAASKIITRICDVHTPGERILCVRKVKETVGNSIYRLFKDILQEDGLTARFTINKTERRFTCADTGSEIICCGLDDAEKIKSITGITSIWIEEGSELSFEDFLQLNLRLRGETVSYKQIILTTNPISEELWIKKFIDNPKAHTDLKTGADLLTVHHSTFLNNNLIDEEYKNTLLTLYSTNELWYSVYVLGNWGKMRTGGEFYKNFLREKHVIKCEYDPELPIHITFDENVKPYFPCLITQIYTGKDDDGKQVKQIRCIDEIAAVTPNNNTTWMAREITRKLLSLGHTTQGLFIYGDATSQKADVKQAAGVDLYVLLMNGLTRFNPHRRIAAANPRVKWKDKNERGRGDWINDFMADNPNAGGIQLMIDPKCTHTIDDFLYTKEDAEGGKDKKEKRNKETGESYQPYGHFSDAFDYEACFAFAEEYGLWKTGGQETKVLFTKKERTW